MEAYSGNTCASNGLILSRLFLSTADSSSLRNSLYVMSAADFMGAEPSPAPLTLAEEPAGVDAGAATGAGGDWFAVTVDGLAEIFPDACPSVWA